MIMRRKSFPIESNALRVNGDNHRFKLVLDAELLEPRIAPAVFQVKTIFVPEPSGPIDPTVDTDDPYGGEGGDDGGTYGDPPSGEGGPAPGPEPGGEPPSEPDPSPEPDPPADNEWKTTGTKMLRY